MSEQKTSIQLSNETKKRLDEIGGKKDTYDDIICRLLDKPLPTTDTLEAIHKKIIDKYEAGENASDLYRQLAKESAKIWAKASIKELEKIAGERLAPQDKKRLAEELKFLFEGNAKKR